jgi:quinol-cytochrome oxidoreductase complex cytochrome b subunit
MVLIVLVHMLRVFYSGAYKRPRQFNWMVGVVLLMLTLGLSFTGYLLPWDQLAYWAITVGTNIAGYVPLMGDGARRVLLGGPDVGGDALLRFYVLHIYLLPALMLLLLGIHIWRVRKDGFAVADRRRPPEATVLEPAVAAREATPAGTAGTATGSTSGEATADA